MFVYSTDLNPGESKSKGCDKSEPVFILNIVIKREKEKLTDKSGHVVERNINYKGSLASVLPILF